MRMCTTEFFVKFCFNSVLFFFFFFQDKDEKATNELSLDKITRLIIYRFITAGLFDVIENVIATGKVELYRQEKKRTVLGKIKVYERRRRFEDRENCYSVPTYSLFRYFALASTS